jgi:putative transposase
MARLAHLDIPGLPHHVTKRRNRRGTTFFEEGDFALYIGLLVEARARARPWTPIFQ